MRVEVRDLIKTFGSAIALDGVSLDIVEGEFCALLGPSGSGKTTLLRLLAGLELPDRGEIRFAGEDVASRNARHRQVGFVFQHYALFRHMSVFENIAFGLRVRPRRVRPSKQEIEDRVHRLLRLVQLNGLAARYPSQLSGGQRQRVALARALAIEPRILLLDEPFGALDAKVRKELRRWLRDLHERLGLTSIFVTHDQEEALELADRVVVMNRGKVEQAGSSQEVYNRPATPFVYDFLGSANVFPCRVRGGRAEIEGLRFDLPAGTEAPDGDADLFVRPHDIVVHADPRQAGLPAVVTGTVTVGPMLRLELRAAASGLPVEAEIWSSSTGDAGFAPGQHVALVPRRFGLFARASGGPGEARRDPPSAKLADPLHGASRIMAR